MRSFLQFLRSMRFAIAILTVVAIASMIGSVLEQGQPSVVYIDRYGEFWAALFQMARLHDIYHAWWFFALLAFMAASTGLCLIQNTPGMLREMRGYRENKSIESLRKCAHHDEIRFSAPPDELRRGLGDFLRRNRFRFKTKKLEHGAYLLAARVGGLRRMGYLLVHGAIVIICVGGLVDGNIGLRLQLFTGALKTETRDMPASQVPGHSRLGADSGSYRASMSLAEGDTHDVAYLPFDDGYLLQELPFAIHLKQFRIEHYANGQPRDFASDIEIIDGPRRIPVTLQVNRPYSHKGVTLYQSGFADGGTRVHMNVQRLDSTAAPIAFQGRVGANSALLIDGQPVSIEFTDFRSTNVIETAAEQETATATWFKQADAGNSMRDVGASVAFRLRDASGQADEWNVYMSPFEIDGAHYRVMGKRKALSDAWHYVRLPLDDERSAMPYRRFAAHLNDAAARKEAAAAIGAKARSPMLAGALENTAATLLANFSEAGMNGMLALIQESVPAAEQTAAAKLYMELLERAAILMLGIEPADPNSARLARNSLQAYSDALEAETPFVFELTRFDPVNASGLQLTRAPGAPLVYLGCALLALGVCAMYFVRERRLWLLITPNNNQLLMAYAANRVSPTLSAEFDAYRAAVSKLI